VGQTGPILGVDLGSKRIGLAISDPECVFAFPAGMLASQGRKKDIQAIGEVIRERDVQRVVVGHPIHMDGRPSENSRSAETFASALSAATGLQVDLLDERWTTRAADRALDESKRGRRQRKEAVDTIAATLLLRTYLQRESGTAFP
jgi:putative Holliday junction resolvase